MVYATQKNLSGRPETVNRVHIPASNNQHCYPIFVNNNIKYDLFLPRSLFMSTTRELALPMYTNTE